MTRYRWLIALAAIATVLTFVAVDHADARAGRGFSFGSRGARTFVAPPVSRTAPSAAKPIQRSVTQPAPVGAAAGAAATRPGLLGGGLFGGGLLGGMAAGFLGAGLFGMLFGHGFMGGMGGFASMLGLIIQIVLVIWVARLAFAWWQRRNGQAPAYAMNGASAAPGPAASGAGLGGLGSMFGGGNAPSGEPITIDKADYDAFETLLTDVQAAYSAEDLAALRAHATPEMVSYFAEQLTENASHGVINRVSDVKLLQGDLAEAWREDGDDYATVAMHFALTDTTVERSSGRTVEGGEAGEVTELWTFRRARGGAWLLSAIQQA